MWKKFLANKNETARGLWFDDLISSYHAKGKPGYYYEWHYLPSFQRELFTPKLVPKGVAKGDWWKSIVGYQIYREREDIKAQTDYDEYDCNSRLSLSQSNLEQRKSGAPPRIETYVELLQFVGRIHTFTKAFFPRSQLYEQSTRLQSHLIRNRDSYKGPAWMKHAASDIIFWFKQIESNDFGPVLPLKAFQSPRGVEFPTPVGYELASISELCRPGAQYDNAALPVGLKVHTFRQPQEERTQEKKPKRSREKSDERGEPDTRSPPKKVKNETLVNVKFSPVLKAYWESASADLKAVLLPALCNNANTSILGMLLKLGVPKGSCCLYHLKGTCSGEQDCRRYGHLHKPYAIQDANAKEVCTLIDKSKK